MNTELHDGPSNIPESLCGAGEVVKTKYIIREIAVVSINLYTS